MQYDIIFIVNFSLKIHNTFGNICFDIVEESWLQTQTSLLKNRIYETVRSSAGYSKNGGFDWSETINWCVTL